MSEFIDSHCHFDFADFDADRQSLWRECRARGIQALVVPGVHPDQWPVVSSLVRQFENIYFGVGIHPWWGDTVDNVSAGNGKALLNRRVEEALEHPHCKAIGECGLDKIRGPDWQRQQEVFAWQLQLAQDCGLPIIIHCVKAHNEVIQLLKRHRLPRGGVIHGFAGSVEIAQEYFDLGFRLGIGGTITYERAKKTRNAVQQMPLAALLLETDAPDMPLDGRQGKRNSPLCVVQVAAALAELRGESLAQVAAVTSKNTRELFSL